MINAYYLKNINIEQLQSNSCSFSQDVSRRLWKNKFHYSAHKIPLLLPEQSQIGSFHAKKHLILSSFVVTFPKSLRPLSDVGHKWETKKSFLYPG
jgi:hypothetical protein